MTIEEKAKLLRKHADEEYKMFKKVLAECGEEFFDKIASYGKSCIHYHAAYIVITDELLKDSRSLQMYGNIIEKLYKCELPIDVLCDIAWRSEFDDELCERYFCLGWLLGDKINELEQNEMEV